MVRGERCHHRRVQEEVLYGTERQYQEYKGRQPELDKDVLTRYKEMGGEIISLGSDSHDPERVGADFKEYAQKLKASGFRWSAHYSKRKLVQLPL